MAIMALVRFWFNVRRAFTRNPSPSSSKKKEKLLSTSYFSRVPEINGDSDSRRAGYKLLILWAQNDPVFHRR